MNPVIETDYLVVGAGAAGMAFTDALIADSDAEVVMVERRHVPGGHWNDAYPFVRLHQPSANYGVNSVRLGNDSIDTTGPNAGFYERATGIEVCEYFHRVLDEHLLPSGRVRFLGMCDYVGDWRSEHVVVSRLAGARTEIEVRRRIVDGTYLDTSVPATHTPGFTVDPDATVIPVGQLVDLAEPPGGFTILGAGKTAMDACNWLVDNGVDPSRIRWVKPRDAWLTDRATLQPLDLVASTIESFSLDIEALAQADDVDDLFRRLERRGLLTRTDPTVEPTMYRGAMLSARELEALRRIERIVRHGRVHHVGADRIVLEDGSVPTDRNEVHVDCTASGFRTVPSRPVFEPGRITLQSFQGGFTTFNAALIGYLEATRDDDAERNRLCDPVPPPSAAIDWISTIVGTLRTATAHLGEPDLAAWLERSRLSLTRGMADHVDDPRLQEALGRWMGNAELALKNADRLLAASADDGGGR